MGRFDVLKCDNSVKEKTQKKRKKEKSNQKSQQLKEEEQDTIKQEQDTIKQEQDTIKQEQDNPPPTKPIISPWVLAMQKRKAEEDETTKYIINENDPKYWNGVKWIGPMFLKSEYSKTIPDSSKSELCSTHIVFRGKTKYSRNGKVWYDTWDDTFSKNQLQSIKNIEAYEYHRNCCKVLGEYCDKLETQSLNYYLETGEMDEYTKAQLDRLEYEKYAEQFEMTEEELEINSNSDEYESDYLEDDDYN
jgi:DNA repair exonuclease SbcCD ATPase subunit